MSRFCRNASNEPTKIAATPSTARPQLSATVTGSSTEDSTAPGSGSMSAAGAASQTHRRNSTNNDALITSADNSGDTAPGALEWAGINQPCMGTSATFIARPTVISTSANAAAEWVPGSAWMTWPACRISSVPVAATRSATPTRKSIAPATATKR